MTISPLRLTYLVLALLGGIQPARWFWLWTQDHGWGIGTMLQGWQVNATTLGQGRDLWIAAIALTVWAIAETRVRRNWSALWALPVTAVVGLSCGLPLYLFLRTRPVS